MIGTLLIPRPLLVKAATIYVDKTSVTGSHYLQPKRRAEAIAALAQIFDVNPIVAQIRLDEMYPPANGQEMF